MRGTVGVALFAALVVGACSGPRENPSVLTDTIGESFGWSCPPTGCELDVLVSTPQLPADCPVGSGWGWMAGAFFETCYFEPDATVSGVADAFPESCRPIVCSTDDDCPYAAFGDGIVYACREGLCESQEPIVAADAFVMCLSATPRPTSCDMYAPLTTPAIEQVVADVGASCPDAGPCKVPADCRQP